LADLALNGIASSLVINKLFLLLGQQLWIALGATEARTTQANSMTLAESSVGLRSINLISTDHFGMVTMAAPEGSCLSLQVFSFVVRIITQTIEKGKTVTID
jgi:hypothetical protein